MAWRVGRSVSSTGGSSHAEKIVRVQGALIVGITEKEHKHFVVYRGTDFRWVYVADPIRGNNRLLINDFSRQWQKNLVLAIAKPGVQVRTTSPLSLRGSDLVSRPDQRSAYSYAT